MAAIDVHALRETRAVVEFDDLEAAEAAFTGSRRRERAASRSRTTRPVPVLPTDDLTEAATAYRRLESFVRRAAERVGEDAGAPVLGAEFTDALDDDLGTPAAMAAVHDLVREGNTALAAGDDQAVAGATWPSFQAGNDTVTLALPLAASAGTRTGP